MIINIILLTLLLIASLWAVLRGSLLRAAISLALASVIVTVLMFRMNLPIAAVFELSVCAGLITAIFIGAISLTKRLSPEEEDIRRKERAIRFQYLPIAVVLILAAMIGAIVLTKQPQFSVPNFLHELSLGAILWNNRQIDILGQIIVLFVGVFGILVLFKEKGNSK